MKRIFTLLLALMLIAAMMTACHNPPANSEGNNVSITPPDDFENETNIPVDDNTPDSGDTDNPSVPPQDTTVTEGFTAKEKKYAYQDGDVMVLDIQNKTDKPYTITVTGTYYDENSNAIKSEVKTLTGFAAGNQQYMLFEPGCKFSSFTYSLSVQEYTGKTTTADFATNAMLLREMKSIIDDLYNNGDHTKYPTLFLHTEFTNNSSQVMQLRIRLVLLKDNGEIYSIYRPGVYYLEAGEAGGPMVVVHQTTEDTLTWPEGLSANSKCILIVDSLGE